MDAYGTREDHESIHMDRNRYRAGRQMLGCMESGAKTDVVGRAGNPGPQAHGYGAPTEMVMDVRNRSIWTALPFKEDLVIVTFF
jgi:hypothetical protein